MENETGQETLNISVLEELEKAHEEKLEKITRLEQMQTELKGIIAGYRQTYDLKDSQIEERKHEAHKIARLKVIVRGIPDEVIKLRAEVVASIQKEPQYNHYTVIQDILCPENATIDAIKKLQAHCHHAFLIHTKNNGNYCVVCGLYEFYEKRAHLRIDRSNAIFMSKGVATERFILNYLWNIKDFGYQQNRLRLDIFKVTKEDILYLFLEP